MDTQIPQLRHQRVWWFQDAGLRKLYFLILVAVLSSATNGYDGSMMNGLQALTYWKTCESVVSPMGHTTTDNDQTSTIHMVQSKGCSMQFSLSGLYVRCQLHRTWQIGLADRRVSSLEVSSSHSEQACSLGRETWACSSLDVFSVSCPSFPHSHSYANNAFSWTRFRYQRHRKSTAHHRARPPQSTRQNHSCLQHLLLFWLNHCCMDDVWHIANRQQLVLETA